MVQIQFDLRTKKKDRESIVEGEKINVIFYKIAGIFVL